MITKYDSAITRVMIFASRIIVVWIITLYLGWEKFQVVELFGFIILMLGILIFNKMIDLECTFCCSINRGSDRTKVPLRSISTLTRNVTTYTIENINQNMLLSSKFLCPFCISIFTFSILCIFTFLVKGRIQSIKRKRKFLDGELKFINITEAEPNVFIVCICIMSIV